MTLRGFFRRITLLCDSRIMQHQNIKHSFVSNPELISHTARINNSFLKGDIHIDACARVLDGVNLVGRIQIGRYTHIEGPDTDVYAKVHSVLIGSFCSIARHVVFQEYNHPLNTCSTYFIQRHVFGDNTNPIWSKGPIIVGNDVWIGTQCIILSGSKIGHGAVIGANSVVTHDIPPYAVAAGSPAQVIRYRFDDIIITRLLSLAWWDWPIDRIQRNRSLFDQPLTLSLFDNIVD